MTRTRIDLIARPAYGLEADPPDDWRLLAACHQPGTDPDWWWPADRSSAGNATTRLALHICHAHCPVMAVCDALLAPLVRHACVVGGRRWVVSGGGTARARESSTTRPSRAGCPICPSTTEESR